MTEVCNPESLQQPESIAQMLDAKFEQAYALAEAGQKGYVVEPKDAKAHYIRLHKDDHDYDLMVGRPLPDSEIPPNVDYSVITIRWRNYVGHGNEDLLVLKDEPDKLFADAGDYQGGLPIDSETTAEIFAFIREAQLQDRHL